MYTPRAKCVAKGIGAEGLALDLTKASNRAVVAKVIEPRTLLSSE